MERQIIKNTEYILFLINNVNNFQEFINNKPEIIKAIKDIVLCCNNILDKNIKSSINLNRKISKNNSQNKDKPTVSNILGLQFNYDSYLTESDTNFIIDYEDNKNKINKTLSKTAKNSFRSKELNNIYNDQKNKNPKNNHKYDKTNKISNILFKINTDENIRHILIKLFGKNIKEQFLSKNISDDFLRQISNAINEIEKLKNKSIKNLLYDKNGNISDSLNKKIFDKNFDNFQYLDPKNEFNYKRLSKYKTAKDLKSSLSSNVSRNNNNFSRKNHKRNNTVRINKSNKPFINATCIYGRYFDEPLQKGGQSKLSDYNQIARYFS